MRKRPLCDSAMEDVPMTMRLASMGVAALIALLAAWPAAAAPPRPDPELGSNTILADGRRHRHHHHHRHWGHRPHPGYYAPYYRPYYPPPRYYAPPLYYAPPPYYGPPRYYAPPGSSFYFQFRN
jgi:hypothetical protein